MISVSSHVFACSNGLGISGDMDTSLLFYMSGCRVCCVLSHVAACSKELGIPCDMGAASIFLVSLLGGCIGWWGRQNANMTGLVLWT